MSSKRKGESQRSPHMYSYLTLKEFPKLFLEEMKKDKR
jgi:hypothetical protein